MNFFTRLIQPFVKNVRFGFATNSSSSHSLVYLVDPSSVEDDLPDGNEFGWGMFHAFTTAAKQTYMMAQGGGWDSEDGYVDHQSVGTLHVKQVDNPNIGVIGGNDNDDSTIEEIQRLHATGVIDLDAMLILGMISEHEYKTVKEWDNNYPW